MWAGWHSVTVRFLHICVQLENFPTAVQGDFYLIFLRMFYLFLISRLKREANVGYNLVWEGSHIKVGSEYFFSFKFFGRSQVKASVNGSKGDLVFSFNEVFFFSFHKIMRCAKKASEVTLSDCTCEVHIVHIVSSEGALVAIPLPLFHITSSRN